MNSFMYRLAWRESRGAWRHLMFFFVSISLGVATLVAVSLFASSLEATIQREARNLMAADIELRTTRPLTLEDRAVLESLDSRKVMRIHVSELVAMAAAGPSTQLVELKAVEPGYPFYGKLMTEPGSAVLALFTGQNALADETLLIRLNLKTGDILKIGQAEFRITGILKKEPDRAAGAFSLGPRVLISQASLDATHLVQPGSRITHRYLLKLPVTILPRTLQTELQQRVTDKAMRVSQYQDAQPMLRRFLGQLTMYLGLVGLIALIVGGVGVATNVRAFLKEKVETIAVLKVLGATPGRVLRVYLSQTVFLGLVGSLAGAAVGSVLQFVVSPLMRPWLPVELEFHLAVVPVARGIVMGVLTSVLFALAPLLEVRALRPNLILRRQVSPDEKRRTRPTTWIATGGLALILSGLALWQAPSWRSAGLFIGGLVVALVLLLFTARALIRGAQALPRWRSLIWRQAVVNLHRPGSQASTVVVSVGIGVMVILAVHLVERNLLWEIGQNVPADAPSFFFLDIQPDQHEGFAKLLVDHGQRDIRLTPVIRSRLSALNGQPIHPKEYEKREHGWYFTREYVLTVQSELPKGNVVTKGQWWRLDEQRLASHGEPHVEPHVSVEEEAARHLGLGLGSSVEFDIQGAKVTGKVTSLRKVDWGNMSTNFYFIFEPGALQGAPMTYVATARVVPADEVPLQRAVVASFPNVSAISIRDMLDSITRVIQHISLAIRFMAGLTILAGLIVVMGALAATRFQRIYETMVLKAVGARRSILGSMFLVEYALLGMAAGLAGSILAAVLAWGVMYWILDVPWLFQPKAIAWGVVATILVTSIVGALSTFRILGYKPLPVLRGE
jgi:putative ABC transport system permease protein